MEKIKRESTNFVGYEYRDIKVTHGMEALWTDSMTNFGWSLEGSSASLAQGINAVNLKFKRDRKIRNKPEITRLQRQFEAGVKEIENLEKIQEHRGGCPCLYIGHCKNRVYGRDSI